MESSGNGSATGPSSTCARAGKAGSNGRATGESRRASRSSSRSPGSRGVGATWASRSTSDRPSSSSVWNRSLGGGTRLHLRESGFERDAARWDNIEGWLSELAELAKHVATEPFEAGIRRTYALSSPVERVWRAFSEPSELGAWWAGSAEIEIQPGFTGWWVWPSEGGRFGMRIDAVEPPRYLCWSWTPVSDVPVAEADQVLRTEWTLVPRDDGGTDLHLFESGFAGPKDFESNGRGWDGDVLPGLRKRLGEA